MSEELVLIKHLFPAWHLGPEDEDPVQGRALFNRSSKCQTVAKVPAPLHSSVCGCQRPHTLTDLVLSF